MNSKAFKGAASAVAQGNNWKSLIQLSLAPGQVVLKTASGHLNTKETALPFTKHSVENGRAYHHFQIAANRDNAPPRYNEWRMLHMARFKVKADGSKKDVLNALKDMEGDSMCDGTWAGDFRGASSMKIWIEWKIGRPEKSKTFRS